MGRTLGQFVDQEHVITWLADCVAHINKAAARGAKTTSKSLKLAVSCATCKTTKTCCSSLVVVRLYEGLVIAADLVARGRNTPELRNLLGERAEAMEATSPYDWRTPCVFLDARERCTVYDARPTSCGGLYVYTPSENCTIPGRPITAYVTSDELAMATELEEDFRQKLSLRHKVGRRYVGVLPRMVLVALEAWDRDDFRDYLRQLEWPDQVAISRWSPRPTT